MKNLAIAILVFYVFISVASPFKCFLCDGKDGEAYSKEQCEEDQTKVDCSSGNYTCFKTHAEDTDGKKAERRGCTRKETCEGYKKLCAGTEEEKKKIKIKDCAAACCDSDGDDPCNMALAASFSMMLIMCAVLCALKLF